MTGWALFTIVALAFAIGSLARGLRRLHYRLAAIEYALARHLLSGGGLSKAGPLPTKEQIEALWHDKVCAHMAKEALKN